MKVIDVDTWFLRCSDEERRAMTDWFQRNGVDHGMAMLIMERRCGVTLLRLAHRGCGSDAHLIDHRPVAGDGLVTCKRPVSVLSEEPFPWPAWLAG